MKSNNLPTGQLLSDKFVSYYQLNHRPTSSKKRIKGGTLKKTNTAVREYTASISSTIRPEQDAKLDRIARPFSKNSSTRPPTAGNSKKQQRKPQFSAKKKFKFTAEDVQGKNNPFIKRESSKENINAQSQIEDDVFEQIGNVKDDDALMPRISQEQYSTRSKIALELEKHELHHNILRADLDFDTESNPEIQELSQKYVRQMKNQRKDEYKPQKREKINQPRKVGEERGFQKLDNIIKLGGELILYEQPIEKENTGEDQMLKLQDENHSSTMKRIYDKISEFKKNAESAKDLADGMMGDIQNLKQFNGAPMIHIPQNFEQVINIAGEQVREQILRQQVNSEQSPYSQFKSNFENKAQSIKKQLPLWSKYIKVTPQTILDPVERAKQEKIIKQLGKIQKQQAKLAEYRKEQRRKKLQTREEQLNSPNIQDISPIKTRSKRNNQEQIIDPESDTFLTNLIKPSSQKGGTDQLVSIPEENQTISTPCTQRDEKQLPASFKKPNIRAGSANSNSVSNMSQFSSISKKDFVAKNIKNAFHSEKGNTYAMKNLTEQERERMNQLLGQIQSESQTLSQIKNQIAIEKRQRQNNSQRANSRIMSDIQEDRKTILSLSNFPHKPDNSTSTALSIVKSTISNKSSIQNQEEFKRIQTINQSLRAIVPIDKWESCSINPNHNNGLSTIKDIQSGASSFTGRGVSKYGSEFSQNTINSLLTGIEASRKLPKQKVLKEQAERRLVDGKLRDIDQNIARLIGQGIDLDLSNQSGENIDEQRIKQLVEQCKTSGAGGVGGPLDVIKEQDLNDKGINSEMSIILCQEEILKQASRLAEQIQQNISSSEQGLLAIEAESKDVIDKNLEQNIEQINKIEEDKLNYKIQNYDKLLGEKKQLVKKLQDSENLLKQVENGIEISAQKFKQQQIAFEESKKIEQSFQNELEQIQQLQDYTQQDDQENKFMDIDRIQREAAQLMKNQSDNNISRDANGEINIQNLLENMSEIQICPIYRP